MRTLLLDTAVKEIKQACERSKDRGQPSPFFFIIGAGISHPPLPLASHIVEHCRSEAERWKLAEEPAPGSTAVDTYSHWFSCAYPHPVDRQVYLRSVMDRAFISRANFRLAHLLLQKTVASIVVTPNFDDLLTRALNLFGERHVVCDHPRTVERINIESNEVQVIHVHGTHFFYDCANLKDEIVPTTAELETFSMSSLLDGILRNRVPLVLGYSGWEADVIMSALRRRLSNRLPRNIYWFCYKSADIDTLPAWLKKSSSLCVVVPRHAPAETTVETEEHASEDINKESTLPATIVLDTLIREFQPEAPKLTVDPLGFFATQLREALWTDELDEEAGDVYAIRSLIERVEYAKGIEKRLPIRINPVLESMRDALRQSDYRRAILEAQHIDLSTLNDDELREVAGAASGASESALENPEKLLACAVAVKAGDALIRRGHPETSIAEMVARVMLQWGVALRSLERDEEAISRFSVLEQRFKDASEPAFRRYVAEALRRKSLALLKLDRIDESLATLDVMVERFGNAPEPPIREHVAMALRNMGSILGTLNRNEEAIAVYDDITQRFGDASEPTIRAQVAIALRNKGAKFGFLGRIDEEIEAYDEVVRRFADAPESAMRDQVAIALRNKGSRLGTLHRNEEAADAYAEVVRRFADATEPAILEQVALALRNKGARLEALNRSEEAISTYDEVVRRFEHASEPGLRGQVAMALRDKGLTFRSLNRSHEELAVFDEVLRRFGDATEANLRTQVANALLHKITTLQTIGQSEEALAAYTEWVGRIGDSSEPEMREVLAKAMVSRVAALRALGRRDEADGAQEQFLLRFGNATEPAIRDLITIVEEHRGFQADQSGRLV